MTTGAAPFAGLASRVRGVREVPAGCFGLSWVAGKAQKYDSGKAPKIRAEGLLWWVNPVMRTLRFAPDESVPEAGLSIDLAPRPGFEHALASWLASLVDAAEIGDRQLLWGVRHRAAEALKLAMQPCLQREDLSLARRALSESLRLAMGMECTGLFRVDLAQERGLPAEEALLPRSGQAGDGLTEKDVGTYLREFEANEAYAERRFFKELPELSALIDRRRHLPGCSDDEAWCRRARDISLLSQHLAKSFASRRPVLSAPAISPETIHLMAVASRQATAGLDAAWAILASENDSAGISPEQILRLESALQQLQLQLERRYTPWWEITA